MPKRLPVLVIAGDHRQFVYYCMEHHRVPNRDAFYVMGRETLMGVRLQDCQLVFEGTWQTHDQIGPIMEYLRMRGAI